MDLSNEISSVEADGRKARIAFALSIASVGLSFVALLLAFATYVELTAG